MIERPLCERVVNAFWRGDSLFTVHRDASSSSVREHRAEHSFFLERKSVPSDLITQFRSTRHCVGIREEGDWLRLCWRYDRPDMNQPANHVRLARFLEDQHRIPTYEADVSPVRRWLVENDVVIERPRRCYLDIETDSRVPFSKKTTARMLSWVIVGEGDGRDVRAGILTADDDRAERELLVLLWKQLLQFDQIVAWNGDRFDFPVIWARSKHHGIQVEHRRWLWLDHMVLFRRMNISAAESGEEKQSLALDAVAHAVLGTGKVDGVTGAQSWDMWSNDRSLLLDYCANDADLMRRIEAETGYIELLQTLCEATHTFPDTYGVQPMGQVETFLMRLGHQRGMHFRTRFEQSVAHGFAGAFVMQPTSKGIVRDVHVADFSRLYPSIILSWNMSPETFRPGIKLRESEERPAYLAHLPRKEFPIPDGHAAAALTDCVFANEPRGILSEALDEMLRLRSHWNKLKASFPPGTHEWKDADRRSSAYKIAANSFYGVVGSPFSRFFKVEVAESVAQSGVWLIKHTIEAAEKRGINVFYGDTDSLFAVGCSREAFAQFVKDCNASLYPGLLKSRGCSRNEIALDYEKGFDRVVMVTAKRYVGRYSHFKGTEAAVDSKPEVKGLEWKRGDVSRLTRECQGEVIRRLMAGDDPPAAESFVELLTAWQQRVLTDELQLADVLLSKRISKPLNEYTRRVNKDGAFAKEPPHVRVARLLKERGQDVGEGVKIEYFVIDGEDMVVAPAADWDRNVDRYYLWESMVFPPAQRLLQAAYPEFDWRRWERVRPHKSPKNQLQLPVGGNERCQAKRSVAQPTTKRLRSTAQAELFGTRHDSDKR